jgi:hypothetical protein
MFRLFCDEHLGVLAAPIRERLVATDVPSSAYVSPARNTGCKMDQIPSESSLRACRIDNIGAFTG